MRYSLVLSFSLFAFLFAVQKCQASEYGMDVKISKAQYVFLGKVISLAEIGSPGEGVGYIKYANVDVLGRVKGYANGTVKLVYSIGISDWGPDCCVVGGEYLIFVSDKVDDLLYPISPDGVYRIGSE